MAVEAERRRTGFLVAVGVGAVVAVSLGVYGNVHDPSGRALFTLFFTSTLNLKAWFATVALALALFLDHRVDSESRLL